MPGCTLVTGLNPCFNGIWSRTKFQVGEFTNKEVLILVLMEYGLGLYEEQFFRVRLERVLILVLMEYGLGLHNSEGTTL